MVGLCCYCYRHQHAKGKRSQPQLHKRRPPQSPGRYSTDEDVHSKGCGDLQGAKNNNPRHAGWRYPEEKRSRTVLTPEEENKLVKWLRDCARAGEGKDKEQLCRTVQGILNAEGRQTVFTNNKPGYKWYAGFMERHKDQLTERKAMVLGEQRAQVTESKICGWFQYAQKILLESSNISKE